MEGKEKDDQGRSQWPRASACSVPTRVLHRGRGSKAQPPMRPTNKVGEEKMRNGRKCKEVGGATSLS